jgi:hypothetical protein
VAQGLGGKVPPWDSAYAPPVDSIHDSATIQSNRGRQTQVPAGRNAPTSVSTGTANSEGGAR